MVAKCYVVHDVEVDTSRHREVIFDLQSYYQKEVLDDSCHHAADAIADLTIPT